MLILKKPGELRNYLKKKRNKKKQIGFVPTMGALHAGHLSLIETSVKINPLTVCSIFVNPTQFNDPEDFKKYPVTIEKDIQLLVNHGCQMLFLPATKDIYSAGLNFPLKYDLGYLETILEGKFRPGHFQGVCQVVHRMLEIVLPDILYLGQKDYQQCMVIKKLIELTGLSNSIRLEVCPTLRESDGLAMSSRNTRLTPAERKIAVTISKSLQFIKDNLQPGNIFSIKEQALHMLKEKNFSVDYVEIADAGTLQLINQWDGQQKIVALAAAYLNQVRLIDNLVIN
jgi:pantoate--beta-alanine ligase